MIIKLFRAVLLRAMELNHRDYLYNLYDYNPNTMLFAYAISGDPQSLEFVQDTFPAFRELFQNNIREAFPRTILYTKVHLQFFAKVCISFKRRIVL